MKISDLKALVSIARIHAARFVFNGIDAPTNRALIASCTHELSIALDRFARLIYTRDTGHHSSGWWKNPDYERCRHLSISFYSMPGHHPEPFDKQEAERIARAFFGEDVHKCWIEPPFSTEGKARDVYHYRLFCDAHWRPIKPRGEVYSRENTPVDWKSYSEIHDNDKMLNDGEKSC